MTAETGPIKLFVEVEYDADTSMRDLAEALEEVEQVAAQLGTVVRAELSGVPPTMQAWKV